MTTVTYLEEGEEKATQTFSGSPGPVHQGGPISNRSVVCVDEGGVRFRYRDHHDGKLKELTLRTEEFLGRLWHVPEKGMQGVRHYGLYGRCAKELREKCRGQLGQPLEGKERVEALSLESYLEKMGHPDKMRCPVCGEPLICVELVARGGSPPGKRDDGYRPVGKAQDRQAT